MSVVTLAEAKEFCEVDFDSQNTVIQILIDAAEEFVEKECGLDLEQDDYEESVEGGGYALHPTHRPVASVDAVADAEADDEEVDEEEWRVDGDLIIRQDEARWESGPNRYTLSYTGGYESVPAALKLLILGLVRRSYENRGGKSSQSAGGQSVSWDELMAGDMGRVLAQFRRTGSVG